MSKRIVVIGGGLGGPRRRLHAGRARKQGAALRGERHSSAAKPPCSRSSGFRFDMGPTIITLPEVLRRIFEEAGRALEDYVDADAPRPAVALLLRRRRDARSHGRCVGHAARSSSVSPARDTAAGYARFMEIAKRSSSDLRRNSFSGRSVGGLARHARSSAQTFKASTLARPRGAAHRPERRRYDPPRGPRRARRADARPLHAVRRLVAVWVAGSAVRHRAHADRGRRLVSPRRHARVAGALTRLARELGVEIATGAAVERILESGGAARGIRLADGRTIEADAVVSNMDTVRTHEGLLERRARARGSAGGAATSPRAPGSCCISACASATTTCCITTSCSRQDPEEEFDAIYREGRPAPDPTCYVAAPAATDPSVAPRRGEALYVLVHTPYLRPGHDWQRMLAPVSAANPRQAQDERRHAGSRGANRVRGGADAGRYRAALPRVARRDLRSGEPRQIPRRIQAGQSQPRSRGASISPAARRTRGPACRWR